MTESLSTEDVSTIIERYKEFGGPDDATYKETAEDLPWSMKTVRKYLKMWEDGKIDDEGHEIEAEDDGDEWSAEPWSGAETDDDSPDFESMGPDDFIKWFFGQDGFGVKQSFVNVLARKSDVRGKIPDKAEMANELINGNSRISNAHEAEGISEVYWDAAQRYLAAHGQMQNTPQVSGSWAGGGQGEAQQSSPAGSWVGTGGARDQPPAQGAPPTGQGQQQTPPQGGYPQQGPPNGHGPPQGAAGVDPELQETLNELTRTQQMILQHLNDPQRSNEEVKTMRERIEEMQAVQQTLEQMRGDNGDNQEISEIRAQLQAMQQQIAEASNGQDSVSVEGDGGIAALARLAANGDLDPETLGVLADSMGVTDPEVKKAEMDLQKAQLQMENRKELAETVLDGISEASGDLVATAVQSLTGGGGDDGGDETQDAGQGGEGSGTVPAGEPAESGEIQVVGDGDGGGRGAGDDLSPTAREHQDDFQNFQENKYRGPTDQPPGAGRSPEPQGCMHVEPDGSMCGDQVVGDGSYCPKHAEEADG